MTSGEPLNGTPSWEKALTTGSSITGSAATSPSTGNAVSLAGSDECGISVSARPSESAWLAAPAASSR
jgi:hypothetical protein